MPSSSASPVHARTPVTTAFVFTLSKFAREAERALQLAVADAIEAHRRAAKPVVVARAGRPVLIDAANIKTVRDSRPGYKTSAPGVARDVALVGEKRAVYTARPAKKRT